ncbi:unnamed protein product [Trichogramma brassicae]|uniref:C2H2-type domain-containing protein n=1 Tax=Trichogramma brassicae TaxID=86971 RepID=A0A6H5IQ75_9HYME|nr:unnamed protein product [Trichogramma brassicae]
MCAKRFDTKHRLLLHIKTAHDGCKEHACDKCKRKFGARSKLNRHQKTVHEGRKDYAYDNCEKKFGQKPHLDLHKTTVHEGRKDFACDKCEKKFGHQFILIRHQEIVHENQNNFACIECEKKFGEKSNLIRHQKTVHEGRKDFACDKCGKKFGDRSNFSKHRKIIHQSNRDFACDKCERKFVNESNLHLHQMFLSRAQTAAVLLPACVILRIVTRVHQVREIFVRRARASRRGRTRAERDAKIIIIFDDVTFRKGWRARRRRLSMETRYKSRAARAAGVVHGRTNTLVRLPFVCTRNCIAPVRACTRSPAKKIIIIMIIIIIIPVTFGADTAFDTYQYIFTIKSQFCIFLSAPNYNILTVKYGKNITRPTYNIHEAHRSLVKELSIKAHTSARVIISDCKTYQRLLEVAAAVAELEAGVIAVAGLVAEQLLLLMIRLLIMLLDDGVGGRRFLDDAGRVAARTAELGLGAAAGRRDAAGLDDRRYQAQQQEIPADQRRQWLEVDRRSWHFVTAMNYVYSMDLRIRGEEV